MAKPTDVLHDHALEAEKHLEQLATGIAGLGADDRTVKGITDMATACRTIAGSLAKSMRDEEPPPQPTTDEAITAHMQQRRAAAGPPPQPAA